MVVVGALRTDRTGLIRFEAGDDDSFTYYSDF